VGTIKVSNDTRKLGPKDFLTGCLVIVVAVFLVPILVLLFKISIYLAIAIGVMVAIVLGIALLGRVVRLIVFPGRRGDKDKNTQF
jgi:cobalamin biosynthesis protein CobD/CbiB